MPPIAPTQCQSLSSSAYASFGVAFQVFSCGYVDDDVSEAELQAEVNAAVQQFGNSADIVAYLVNKDILSNTADEDEVVEVVSATLLLAAKRDPTNGWSCCLDSSTGGWFPYHNKYGWDRSQRCA